MCRVDRLFFVRQNGGCNSLCLGNSPFLRSSQDRTSFVALISGLPLICRSSSILEGVLEVPHEYCLRRLEAHFEASHNAWQDTRTRHYGGSEPCRSQGRFLLFFRLDHQKIQYGTGFPHTRDKPRGHPPLRETFRG